MITIAQTLACALVALPFAAIAFQCHRLVASSMVARVWFAFSTFVTVCVLVYLGAETLTDDTSPPARVETR
ncbi:hypothetical protein KL864_33220 [Mycolicibacterium goodii]|uniref:hypothetical protein n=1 Tax=Mycolicibacterium goodii TaxID=134601 RepID=UPI001BDC5DD3|nr:hypothetical protein [Mycolicibacterium goodii]MBU8820732.1 hypothetical protein [Mycolicibacterium goodii]